VCGLYLNPPDNAVVWSVDEKSGMQAKSRKNPTRPAMPGRLTRREFEYVRHGTAVLQRRLLRYGEVDSVDDLADRVIAFIDDYNRKAMPFRWTYEGRPLKVA